MLSASYGPAPRHMLAGQLLLLLRYPGILDLRPGAVADFTARLDLFF